MPNRFPRTPAEFAATGRAVVFRCDCGSTTWVKAANLVQRLGPDFDLYDGFAELVDAFPCDVCGATRQQVAFYKPDDERHFENKSFEDATVAGLELNAFASARDSLLDPGMRARQTEGGRRRRFGPRGR